MNTHRIPNPALLRFASGIVISFVSATVHADVRVPRIFSEHMVLQRDKPAQVWGWAEPGERVSVKFGGQNLSGMANQEGAWSIKLAPMPANATPQDLVVSGNNTLTFSDILVGDVWMVSGQSNSVFAMGGCNDAASTATADVPTIRFSGYWELFAGAPQRDGGASWNVLSPGSAGNCSAIGYYFARRIHREIGIPIGILTCGVGGTDIENWMSPEAINDYPANAKVAQAYRETITGWESEMSTPRKTGPGENRPAYLPSDQSIGLDPALTWCAQVRVGLQAANTPVDRSFTELEDWIIASRTAVSANKSVPPMPEFADVGNWLQATGLPAALKRIPLAPHPLSDRWGIGGHGWFRTQSLFNGMVHPMLPFTIKGMLWYQGEGGSGLEYHERMRSMVEDLRKKKNDEFPVYIVQLANYEKANDEPQGGKNVENFPITRMEQLKCLQIPKTGLAVTIDVGDADDIHPKNKFDVGERLALWALAKDYGKQYVCSGPLYKGMQVGKGKIRITFDSVGAGLMIGKKEGLRPTLEEPGAKLKRFAIAGEDKKWVWADAVIDGNSVVVSSPVVPKPVAVRYAFSMNPEGCNLYNKEGLPASPFRTDEW
jgi:sialate O-acetylesterase